MSVFVLSLIAAVATPVKLPDSPAARVGERLVAHLNSDRPAQLQAFAESLFSAAAPAEEKTGFVKLLLAAQEESGGVELVAARPGRTETNAVLTVRAKKAPRFALLVLLADPKEPAKLKEALFVATEDPQLYAGWPETKVSREELVSLVRNGIDRLVKSADFSGCVAVELSGSRLVDECHGIAERSFGVPVDSATRFHIGSMDKMFTATAIAQLVQQGKLTWTSTLAQLVPEYPDKAAAQKITVWQLLHHRAGLGDFFVPEFFDHRQNFVDPKDYLDLIARQPKVAEPGQQWSYSNAGFVLLGRILENASGENYFEYVRRHIFVPAGMDSTGFDSLEDVLPKVAIGYLRDDPFAMGSWKANWMTLPFKGSPAGGGYSTNVDLLRFAQALRAGKLLKPATLAKMFEDESSVGPDQAYAAGFDDQTVKGRHLRGHNGGAPGMNAALSFVWETGAAVAVTSNEDGPAAQNLADHIAALLAAQ